MKRSAALLAALALVGSGDALAQYNGTYSKSYHSSLLQLQLHIAEASRVAFSLMASAQENATDAGRRELLAKFMKEMSGALFGMHGKCVKLFFGLEESLSSKVKPKMYDGKRPTRAILKKDFHDILDNLAQTYAIYQTLVSKTVPEPKRVELQKTFRTNLAELKELREKIDAELK